MSQSTARRATLLLAALLVTACSSVTSFDDFRFDVAEVHDAEPDAVELDAPLAELDAAPLVVDAGLADVADAGCAGVWCSNEHGSTSCRASVCQPVCAPSWGNCDGVRENGCETALGDAGACAWALP